MGLGWVLPLPVTVYIRGPIEGFMYIYYSDCPTATEGGEYPRFRV